jgi:hypothetical protein
VQAPPPALAELRYALIYLRREHRRVQTGEHDYGRKAILHTR